MANVPDHLERFLGPIEGGYSTDADGNKQHFQVVRFNRVPIDGVTAYATLGLCRHPTDSGKAGAQIRLELLILVRDAQAKSPMAGILQQVALETVMVGRPLLHGDVVGPKGPLVNGSAMEAFYATEPLLFSSEFNAAEENGVPVIIAWLVPISRNEATFVAERGWPAFEALLLERDPDLTDLYRRSIVS
jgi:hypothetical protein